MAKTILSLPPLVQKHYSVILRFAVNPEDERYVHLVGKILCCQLLAVQLPSLLTNMLKRIRYRLCESTPAHDFNDYEVGKRCGLALINIFNKNAEVLAEFEYIEKPVSRFLKLSLRLQTISV